MQDCSERSWAGAHTEQAAETVRGQRHVRKAHDGKTAVCVIIDRPDQYQLSGDTQNAHVVVGDGQARCIAIGQAHQL